MASRRAALLALLPLGLFCMLGGCNALFGTDDLRYLSTADGGAASDGGGAPGGGGGSRGIGGAPTGSAGGVGGVGGAGGVGGVGPPRKVLTFHTHAAQDNAAVSFLFNDMPIGSPSPDRRVILGIVGNQLNTSLIEVAVGEVTAEILDMIVINAEHTTALAIAHVPNGTAADITLTFDSFENRAGIGVWSATGLSSNEPHDIDDAAGEPTAVTLDTLPGGFVVAIAGHVDGADVSWPSPEMRFSEKVDGHSSRYTGADGLTTGSSLGVQVIGLTDDRRGLVAASW
jgi:hypothetical protein